jgi:thiamine biosynthesis lipoprotein
MKKRSRVKRLGVLAFVAVQAITLLSGCAPAGDDNTNNTSSNESTANKDGSVSEPLTQSSFLLNTVVTITLYDSTDQSIIDGALDVISKYEDIYSRTLENSELYKLNHGTLPKAPVSENSYIVSDELASLLTSGLYYSNISKGKFDITIAPVSSLWDFTSLTPLVPTKTDIENAVKKVGYENMVIEGNTVTFKEEGMAIDLGAIAKGYIADRVKEYIIAQGVKSAMINLGGNVLCVGEKPSGQAFKVGIQKPFADRNEIVATMEINDLSVVSSGIYERYFMENDKLYHHILNPETGYSYENNLVSVSIISEKSVDGDGLSTSCFALGLEEGMDLINSLKGVHAIFITDDYEMHYSDGFFDAIKVTEVEP